VLAQRHQQRGTPLRARVFARIAALSRLGSRAGWLLNRLASFAPARLFLHRFLGIHKERPLPAFAPQSFPRWFKGRQTATSTPAPRGQAVLFHDTFTDYYHPEAGRAAIRVLEALGYEVVVVDRTACCGRPAISKGLLPTAKEWARRNVEAFLPYAARGVPIIGTEPSCLLTFRDEYPDLLQDDASRTVAAQAMLLDELIVRLVQEDESVRGIFGNEGKPPVLLHAHCHQKAIVGADCTLSALRLAGYDAQLIESGCCGMAGSFGFEQEHYEISKAMGAYRLFPAVEAAAQDTQIAITGVSCRQQIGHFTSRRPRHAVELLAEALR
jgi:Fe-S oxidoreductase